MIQGRCLTTKTNSLSNLSPPLDHQLREAHAIAFSTVLWILRSMLLFLGPLHGYSRMNDLDVSREVSVDSFFPLLGLDFEDDRHC